MVHFVILTVLKRSEIKANVDIVIMGDPYDGEQIKIATPRFGDNPSGYKFKYQLQDVVLSQYGVFIGVVSPLSKVQVIKTQQFIHDNYLTKYKIHPDCVLLFNQVPLNVRAAKKTNDSLLDPMRRDMLANYNFKPAHKLVKIEFSSNFSSREDIAALCVTLEQSMIGMMMRKTWSHQKYPIMAMIFPITESTLQVWNQHTRLGMDVVFINDKDMIIKVDQMPAGFGYPSVTLSRVQIPSSAKYFIELPFGFMKANGYTVKDFIVLRKKA